MGRVTPDEFLAKVAAMYKTTVPTGCKGTVAVGCKSVPPARVHRDGEGFERMLLFRAARYGNNHHKTKCSTVVTPREHARFHSRLSAIVKTRADASKGGPGRPRGISSGKKATE